MIGAFFGRRPGGGGMKIGIAHDSNVLAKRFQRLQSLAEFEIAAFVGRRPVVLLGAVSSAPGGSMDHLDACQASLRDRRSSCHRRLRRDHGVQQR